MRTALDEGDPRRALDVLNHELKVRTDSALPRNMRSSNAVLVLDRATVQQSIGQLAGSRRDYEAADKAIDVLDLSHGAADVAGRWLYSDSARRYVAPPHEKLLLNILNMVNYLETNDLSGARVEARRMSVTARYLRAQDRDPTAALRFGSRQAGFTYEKSGNPEEARRYYDDAQMVTVAPALEAPSDPDAGELLVVVGWGRVPHLVAKHVSVGTNFLTWVNYPTLAPDAPPGQGPTILVDGRPAALDVILDVAAEVRADWKQIEGTVMAAALTRTATRAAVGGAIEGAAKTSDNKDVQAVGVLLSLFAQIAMTTADVPDTRSWETLPARLGLARLRVAPGTHRVVLEARGYRREGDVRVEVGGWAGTSLLALR